MENKKQVIILNAPPESGKDTVADHFMKKGHGHYRFKTQLYKLVCSIYDTTMSDINYFNLRENKTDAKKWTKDYGTFRDALIKVSEDVIKPNFGVMYFGNHLGKSIKEGNTQYNFVSDGGFKEEILAIQVHLGTDNVHLVKIVRPDVATFEEARDSRRYLPDNMFGSTHTILNDGDMNDLVLKAEQVFEQIKQKVEIKV